jgi:heme-degrading monooxygenase HmoA
MFARVAMIKGKPEKVDDVVRYFKEQTVAAAKKMNGFKQAYMMVNHQTGDIIGMVHWETQQSITDSQPNANRFIPQMKQISGATEEPMVEIYEVAVAEMPAAVGMK